MGTRAFWGFFRRKKNDEPSGSACRIALQSPAGTIADSPNLTFAERLRRLFPEEVDESGLKIRRR